MIDLKNLTKEQKQYIGLGLIAVAAILYGVSLVVGKVVGADKTSKSELDELTQKIEQAESALNNEAKLYQDLEQAEKELDEFLRLMPEYGNEYIWATEQVYALINGSGINLKSVDKLAVAAPKKKAGQKKNGSDPSIGSYAVRLVATGGYTQLCQLLEKISQENPLMSVQQIDLSGNASSPERHNLKIDLSWPKLLESEDK